MKGRTKMTTTRINLKRTLLLGTLILSLSGMVGCSTNNPQQETEDNKKTVELKPNELSLEETRALKPGDIVPEGKEVNRELLEQQGMDVLYVYHTYEKCEGDLVGNSELDIYTYNEHPSQEEKIVASETIITYYEFLRKEIVEIEFVKDAEGIYKKRALPKGFQFTLKLVDVIDENNIDKDKVKTVK